MVNILKKESFTDKVYKDKILLRSDVIEDEIRM